MALVATAQGGYPPALGGGGYPPGAVASNPMLARGGASKASNGDFNYLHNVGERQD